MLLLILIRVLQLLRLKWQPPKVKCTCPRQELNAEREREREEVERRNVMNSVKMFLISGKNRNSGIYLFIVTKEEELPQEMCKVGETLCYHV